MEPRLSADQFSHLFNYRVRSHECDRQGIVHNARYLEILEVARIEFVRDVLKTPIDDTSFVTHDKYFTVRNAIDYFIPATFDEELTVLTRISKIGRTSVTFEQIINASHDNRRVIESESVMVHVDPVTNLPIPISESYKSLVAR
jgi:acyl-CoA thioester hydrolase